MNSPRSRLQLHQPATAAPNHEWIVRQILYGEILNSLDDDFKRFGITYMPIKGAYLIRAGLAEKLRARKMVDIDILVRQRDYTNALRLFEHDGKATRIKDPWPFERLFEYSADGRACLLEIKCQLDTYDRFLLGTEDLFARGIQSGDACVLPSATDAMLVLLCHSIQHIAHEPPHGLAEEIDAIAQQTGFRWVELNERLRHTGVSAYVQMLIRAAAPSAVQHGDGGPGLYGGRIARLVRGGGFYVLPLFMRRLLIEIIYARRPVHLVCSRALKRRLPQ